MTQKWLKKLRTTYFWHVSFDDVHLKQEQKGSGSLKVMSNVIDLDIFMVFVDNNNKIE